MTVPIESILPILECTSEVDPSDKMQLGFYKNIGSKATPLARCAVVSFDGAKDELIRTMPKDMTTCDAL